MQRIRLEEAAQQLNALIDAAVDCETVVLVRDDQTEIQLVPIIAKNQPRKAGSAKGQFVMADDFDEPLSDFADDI
ncbi:MAG: DUF2281 domain-containing protein [Chitinophagaceae bacterium]|nr:DUF2281 domain-containing protein [Anaerolineae bacterium]